MAADAPFFLVVGREAHGRQKNGAGANSATQASAQRTTGARAERSGSPKKPLKIQAYR
jgi:hypothetical protein